MANSLELRQICISQSDTPLLAINHVVNGGDVLTIMGPSGVGKSTLLSAITGNLSSHFSLHGEIWLNSRNITSLPSEKRRIGILFQDDLLFPHFSVGTNLAFGLPPGPSKKERKDIISNALIEIGLKGYENRDPSTLSGGQKARVALMRMLLSQPSALLLDEAFSGLDTSLRDQMRSLVFGRAKELELPVIMVTHDIQDADAADGTIINLGG